MFGKSIAKKIAAQVAKAAPAQVAKAAPASKTPQLSDAINTLKTGNKAGATDMLRSIVGLPSSAPISAPAKTGTPAAVNPTPVVTSSPLKPNPVATPAPAAAPQRFGNGLARAVANNTARQVAPAMKKGGKVSSASSRGDGIAQRGKTKGRYL